MSYFGRNRNQYGRDLNKKNEMEVWSIANEYIEGKKELKEVIEEFKGFFSKVSSKQRNDSLYKLSVSKAIYLVSVINELYKKQEKRELEEKDLLYEAAKLVYVGNKNNGQGKFWFKGISRFLEKASKSEEEKKEKILHLLKLICTYLAAYSKN